MVAAGHMQLQHLHNDCAVGGLVRSMVQLHRGACERRHQQVGACNLAASRLGGFPDSSRWAKVQYAQAVKR